MSPRPGQHPLIGNFLLSLDVLGESGRLAVLRMIPYLALSYLLFTPVGVGVLYLSRRRGATAPSEPPVAELAMALALIAAASAVLVVVTRGSIRAARGEAEALRAGPPDGRRRLATAALLWAFLLALLAISMFFFLTKVPAPSFWLQVLKLYWTVVLLVVAGLWILAPAISLLEDRGPLDSLGASWRLSVRLGNPFVLVVVGLCFLGVLGGWMLSRLVGGALGVELLPLDAQLLTFPPLLVFAAVFSTVGVLRGRALAREGEPGDTAAIFD